MKAKKLFLLFLLLHGACWIFAQSVSVKGHGMLIPTDSEIYTLGGGLEVGLSNHWSVQLFAAQSGSDFRGWDGAEKRFRRLIPEFRFYFRSMEDISVRRRMFVGLFTEIGKVRIIPSGEGRDEDRYLLETRERFVAPGLLIGQQWRIGRRWGIEIFGGVKRQHTKRTEEWLGNPPNLVNPPDRKKIRGRLGLNVVYYVGATF